MFKNVTLHACMCILLSLPTPLLYVPGWDFPHSEAATKVRLHTSMLLRCVISPIRSLGFAAGTSPSQSSDFAALLMGFPPLESTCDPDSATRIFPSQDAQLRSWDFPHSEDKTYRNHWWDYPHWGTQQTYQTIHAPSQMSWSQIQALWGDAVNSKLNRW